MIMNWHTFVVGSVCQPWCLSGLSVVVARNCSLWQVWSNTQKVCALSSSLVLDGNGMTKLKMNHQAFHWFCIHCL